MNRKQRTLSIAALSLFCLSVLCAPWAGHNRAPSYRPIFFVPAEGYYLQWQALLCEWLAIGILYASIFWLFKSAEIKVTRKAVFGAIIVLVLIVIAACAIFALSPARSTFTILP